MNDWIQSMPLSKFKIQNKFKWPAGQKPISTSKYLDEEGLVELAESIRQNGIFQPIIVSRKLKATAGERRLRSVWAEEKETIPAIVRDYSEETMIQIAVGENLQRETWNH